ncbi:MAG: hypothetical protein COA90_00405 [Gammaproteobacteria bacterium]|nr:MAG: hypothetical protein COA90_00405 [Gammaproteobacteria bacterium]
MNIILRYIDVCLFKAGPADMPASNRVLLMTLLSYVLINIIVSQTEYSLNASLFTSIADLLFMLLTVTLLLKLRAKQSRLNQTLSALAGSSCCMAIVSLPAVIWFSGIAEAEQASSYAMIFLVGFMFWSLMVMSHIFRQALEVKAGVATAITVVYVTLSLLVFGITMSGVA